jgi:MFS transporter, DHA1 family, inner membrane transport protein
MLVAKILANMAFRTPYVFLNSLSKDLGTTVGRLGALMGFGELLGMLTSAIGRSLDQGRYRRWTAIGGGSVVIGALIMSFANTAIVFAVGFSCVGVGVAWLTTTAHSWLGTVVAYDRRGQAIGLYELSWALSILLGAPIVGVLSRFGWGVPFAVLSIAAALSTITAARQLQPSAYFVEILDSHKYQRSTTRSWLPRHVMLSMASSFLLTFAAISIFSVYGTWLEKRFGLSTQIVGVLSVSIGVAELFASSTAASRMDRWGKIRSIAGGIATMLVGILALLVVPKITALAIASLVVVFLGFEFGFVALLTLISEIGAEQRGTVVALDHALSPISRAGSAALATSLFDLHGMRYPAFIALGFASASLAALRLSQATQTAAAKKSET